MKILVATDGSAHVACAISLLQRLTGFKNHQFVLLSVSDAREVALISAPIPGALELLLENLDQEARTALKNHSRLFPGAETLQVLHRQGDAADVILQVSEETGADLIVLGAQCPGPVSGPLLGSVSHRVAAHSRCSVLLGRTKEIDFAEGLRVILGIDGSPRAQTATELLGRFPLRSSDQIQCVQVLTLVKAFRMDVVQKMSEVWAQEKKVAQENVDSAKSSLENSSAAQISDLLGEGTNAGEVLTEMAKEHSAHLVAIGHRGLGLIRRFLLGSVSSFVLHNSPCAVLIVKTEDKPDFREQLSRCPELV